MAIVAASNAAESPTPDATRNIMLFTKDNARDMAAKSAEARRKYPPRSNRTEEEIKAAVAQAKLELEALTGDFAKVRLSRVRAQLNRIDEMMQSEEDPQRLDRLASAQARLSVQEFALSGRPNPGSRRPGRETPSKRSGEVEPVE